MQKFINFLFLSFLFFSCQNSVSDTTTQTSNQEVVVEAGLSKKKTPKAKQASNKKGTLLCMVNGEPWYYSSASGAIMGSEKGVVTATFKFAEHRDKALQVRYDYITKEIIGGLLSPIEINHKGKEEYMLTRLDRESMKGNCTLELHGEGERKGYMGLVSGSASFDAVSRISKTKYEIRDLKFNNIRYSNLHDFTMAGYPKKSN